MLGLIWIQTVCNSDGIPERIVPKVDFEKKQKKTKKHVMSFHPGIFFAVLGRGPRAFQIGLCSVVNP